MEFAKKFLRNPKVTAILGLIGSIVMVLNLVCTYSSIYDILTNMYVLGLIIYFIVILMRMFFQKGNIKVANYILIISFVITIVMEIYSCITLEISSLLLVALAIHIVLLLFFLNILIKKVQIVNNKVFLLSVIAFAIYNFVRIKKYSQFFMAYRFSVEFELICWVLMYVGYLLIIPYFYNYYNILKGERENGK